MDIRTFKIGDRVQIFKSEKAGRVGTIVGFSEEEPFDVNQYHVQFPDVTDGWYAMDDLVALGPGGEQDGQT